MAGCLRGQAEQRQATHSVEALDIADVLVDEEVHLVGHAGHAAARPGPETRDMSDSQMGVVLVGAGGTGGSSCCCRHGADRGGA